MSHVDLLASSTGTTIAELITLPICTIKTNYQTNLQYTSIFHAYKDVVSTRGIKGLYQASLSATAAQIVSTATKFTFYNHVKNYRGTQQKDLKNNIINGAFGGVAASIFSHPFDVIKVHQQNNVPFIAEFKKTGPSLFYRGYSKSLSKNIMLTSLVFPFYDFYKSKAFTGNNPWIASGLASLTVTTFLHPIDYLKVRHISNQPLYFGFSDIRKYFKYYYRGFHINLMRVVPHFMITMAITEKIKKKFV